MWHGGFVKEGESFKPRMQ